MMGRLIRQLRGCGHRAENAERIMREHETETASDKREIKARVAALERLLDHLEKDTQSWH